VGPKGPAGRGWASGSKYSLRECNSIHYPVRTEKNVLDSDGTLILFYNGLIGGSLLTQKLAKKHGRPIIAIDLAKNHHSFEKVTEWIAENKIIILNIAGPRASSSPKIHEGALEFLRHLFS